MEHRVGGRAHQPHRKPPSPLLPTGPAVALKLLRRDTVSRSTFLREFCVGRCVSSHPGLLQTLTGPLETPQYFAFAQEFAPCGDLSEMLQERVRLMGREGGPLCLSSSPQQHFCTPHSCTPWPASHSQSSCSCPTPDPLSIAWDWAAGA